MGPVFSTAGTELVSIWKERKSNFLDLQKGKYALLFQLDKHIMYSMSSNKWAFGISSICFAILLAKISLCERSCQTVWAKSL